MSFLKLLFLLFLSFNTFALTQNQINRLDLLNKTWNVAKMYHSGACATNWDDALLTAIPQVIQSQDNTDFNSALNNMLDLLGNNQISNETPVQTPDFLKQKQDYSWLQNDFLESSTKSRISNIIDEFRPRATCLFSEDGSLQADSQYFNILNPTPEQKLLGLFRYWGIYNYFSPYKNIISHDWTISAKNRIDAVYNSQSLRDYLLQIILLV